MTSFCCFSVKDQEKAPVVPELVPPVTDFDPLPAEIFTEPIQLDKGQILFLNSKT